MKIGTSNDIRQIDELVIIDYAVEQSLLMENAAFAARQTIERLMPIEGKKVLVVCGTGNNGGDGLALVRLLHARGAELTVLIAGDTSKFSSASENNYRAVRQLPIPIFILDSANPPSLLSRIDMNSFDLIVDGIFGTGLSRPVKGAIEHLIAGINESTSPVMALDIPSGINADSGHIMGSAVKADATVTFGIVKRGNLLYPGHEWGGELFYSNISFPPEAVVTQSINCQVNLPSGMSKRQADGHKGSFGKVLIVGGCINYRGAPALASNATLRSGAGYVTTVLPSHIADSVSAFCPEVVLFPMEGDGFLKSKHLPQILELVDRADAVVLGPGISTEKDSAQLVQNLIADMEVKPIVIDGDGLTALAGFDELTQKRSIPAVLTPHSGEMAKLLGTSQKEVESHRIESALEAAQRYGSLIVLKGAHSIIAEPSGQCWINLTGNSGMGTAGSGDVLAGMVASFLAVTDDVEWQGMLEALKQAVYLHGLAGDQASKNLGEVAMKASDIIMGIPEAIRHFATHRNLEDMFNGKIILL